MIIIALFFGVLFVLCGYMAIRTRRADRMTISLPCPPYKLPILGNALTFLGNSVELLQCLQNMALLASKHRDVSKCWIGPKLYIAIANPIDAQVIQENHLEKDGVYKFLKTWLGEGLFVAPLDLWKAHRKIMLPVFHNKVIDEYIGVMNQQAETLVKCLSFKLNKDEFDVMSYIVACTLDIVFETAMGEKMDVQHYPQTPYLKARSSVINIINMRFFKVWLQPDFLFNLTNFSKEQQRDIQMTQKFADKVIEKKRKQYEESKRQSGKKDGKHNSVLDMLLQKDFTFTNKQLREQIDSLTVAGNDTTALVIAYSLVLLGSHQGIQEKAFQEQKSIFGDSDRHASKDDLQNMHNLERIIKESMRLYTVVPIIARSVKQDTFLPHCGITVPAGCGAVVAAFAIHRNKKFWGDDADAFDPDRFLPERSKNRHSAAFQGFSFGARNCIGRNFGMLIMKCSLSHILRKYKIESSGMGPLKMEMLLVPIDGHKIKIIHRQDTDAI